MDEDFFSDFYGDNFVDCGSGCVDRYEVWSLIAPGCDDDYVCEIFATLCYE